MKTSIPKLHSITYKEGIMAENVDMHPVDFKYTNELFDRLSEVIGDYGNLTCYEVVGVLEYVKKDYLKS